MRDSLFRSNHGWTASLASIVDHELFIVLFLSLAACGWKGLVDDTRSVGLSLPSSILFNTLPVFVIEITSMSKMYRRA